MKYGLASFFACLLLFAAGACRDDEQNGASRGDREVLFDVSLQGVQPVRGALPAYDDMPVVTDQGDTCYLGVSVSAEWPVAEPATRASLSSTADLQTSSAGFGLYQYDGSTQKLDNVQYKYVSSLWSPQFGDGAVWPGSGTTTFYAYAPYVSSSTWTDNSKLSFTVHASNSAQTDLLVAQSTYTNVSSGRVALNFTHALTAVRFVANNNINLTIKSIAFTGVANSGKYDFSTSSWTDVSGSTDISISFSSDRNVTGSPSLPEITHTTTSDKNEYFLMMPQTFTSSSAKIVITKSDDTTIEFALNGTAAWEPGTVVTYELRKNPYTYEFEISNDISTTYLGSTEHFTLTSVKKENGTPIAYPDFDVECYDEAHSTWVSPGNANWPSWLSFSKTTPSGMDTQQDVTVTAQTSSTSTTVSYSVLNNQLQNATPLGTESNPYDLSLVNVATNEVASDINHRTTANCYVVSAPGWYKIPMVYGNAIQDGACVVNGGVNTVNHNAVQITQATGAWLSDYGVDVTTARLLWQDAPHKISNLSVATYTEGGEYRKFIKFYVKAEDLQQCNAVITAHESSANDAPVVWSWHIWVTPLNLSDAFHLDDGVVSTDLAQVHLGWCWSKGALLTSSYPGRIAILRLTQKLDGTPTGKYCNLTVTQASYNTPYYVNTGTAYDGNYDGYCPYYQWGRKDPIPPQESAGNSTNFQKCRSVYRDDDAALTAAYYYDGTSDERVYRLYQTFPSEEKNHFELLVQKPFSFFSMDFYTTGDYVPYIGLWMDNMKSIYDPCPVGFRVPSIHDLSVLKSLHHFGLYRDGSLIQSYSVTLSSYFIASKLNNLIAFPASGNCTNGYYPNTSWGFTGTTFGVLHAVITSTLLSSWTGSYGPLVGWAAEGDFYHPVDASDPFTMSYYYTGQTSTSADGTMFQWWGSSNPVRPIKE